MKKWVVGRRGWRQVLSGFADHPKTGQTIWMHCASLGEFEQGRPLLESIRKHYPKAKILLTFFSPSGYEIRKNYEGADLVMYLPFDGPGNARDFLSLVKPDLALFVKYEFWHFYLKELEKRKIPALLISAIFRPSQPFFQKWGGFHRHMLQRFSQIFVQDNTSAELLNGIGMHLKTTISGDTRFDRVLTLANAPSSVGPLPLDPDKKVMVAGSTWEEDEVLLAEWLKDRQDWQLLIAPHEVHASKIRKLLALFPNAILFTELTDRSTKNYPVIIINTIGVLSRLYAYSTLCYVGGGFSRKGHHNILEAAVHGKMVVTGPVHEKFAESVALKKAGGSVTILHKEELSALSDDEERMQQGGKIAGEYVREQAGATEKIMAFIQENRLLTRA